LSRELNAKGAAQSEWQRFFAVRSSLSPKSKRRILLPIIHNFLDE
jgi:hypothetical protein